MSVWSSPVSGHPFLSGSQGELVQVRVTTDPRHLEELLECLAGVSFPINPQIIHGLPTTVEFPAYEARLFEVRGALRAFGFDASSCKVSSMIDTIR